MKKIVFVEPLGIENKELKAVIDSYLHGGADITYYDRVAESKKELIARCTSAEVIVTAQVPIDKEVIDNCPDLRYICVAFTGTDHIDKEYCRQRGITVSNCKGYSTSAVADLVFALVLNILRNVNECDRTIREGSNKKMPAGEELEGKTFGIIGLGEIGCRVARIANAFGCKVIAYNRHHKKVENVTQVELNTLLKESDIVSLHVPANEQTRHMIGKEQLELMKSSAVLINCARGAVVDNVALTEALNKGIIAGAGVDVFDYEPPLKKDYCLLQGKNCILTPHIGFATKQAFIKRAHIVGENLLGYIHNKPINIVIE
ncbi:MAG: NAD(P)-dependent oxidoreductase [Erysipelotrichia bacterium]|nr:NAD(P)-dependent oxidoreductase [Erysipelotrichia bacterium]